MLEKNNLNVGICENIRESLNEIPIPIWRSGSDARSIFFNNAWSKFTGGSGAEVMEMSWLQSIHPDDVEQIVDKYLKSFNERIAFDYHFRLRNADGNYRNMFCKANPVFDEENIFSGFIGICSDITEYIAVEGTLNKQIRQKEQLVKDIHHRVKNNLQVISSMLALQIDGITDYTTRALFNDAHNRIKSLALLYEYLYRSGNFTDIDFSEYANRLLKNLSYSFTDVIGKVRLNIDAQETLLNVEIAIPLGLIINELVSNCYKHAFTVDTREPEITVKIKKDENRIQICIADNGVGLPGAIDIYETNTLGLQLVTGLIKQLKGSIYFNVNNGTLYILDFQIGK